METTVIVNAAYTVLLCKIIGLNLTVIMLGLLLNRKHFEAMAESLANTPSMHFPATLLPLMMGSIILATHNDWGVAHAAILVTLFGCACFIGGFVRAVFPDFWVSKIREYHATSKVRTVLMGMLGLGVVFLYAGFFG